jgi:hypothetical protein
MDGLENNERGRDWCINQARALARLPSMDASHIRPINNSIANSNGEVFVPKVVACGDDKPSSPNNGSDDDDDDDDAPPLMDDEFD